MASSLARYARHLLLPQIGEAGQRRLLEVALRLEGDAGVVKVAERYLSRAGVRTDGDASVKVASRDEVARTAGDPALLPAARALLGALAAVDVVRASLGLPGKSSSESVPVLSPSKELS